MILDATTDSLEIVLAGAVSTSQVQVTVAYSELDAAAGTVTPGSATTQSNNTTAVTILAAPAAGKQRVVDSILVYNKDTASATPTIQFNDNGTIRPLKKKALATTEDFVFIRGRGWG